MGTADKAGRAGQGRAPAWGLPPAGQGNSVLQPSLGSWMGMRNGHIVAGVHTCTHVNSKCNCRRGCLEMLLPTAHGWPHPGSPSAWNGRCQELRQARTEPDARGQEAWPLDTQTVPILDQYVVLGLQDACPHGAQHLGCQRAAPTALPAGYGARLGHAVPRLRVLWTRGLGTRL